MMRQVIQCVPNFSEGRDQGVVEEIVRAARETSDVRVINYSSDPDHNRMVLTMLGSPDEVRASMLAAAKRAVELIDMRSHEGVHPRIGAIDVVPLVPVRDISVQECVDLSYLTGGDIAQLGVPVYFYEQSAKSSHHVKLADIRKGGFEALSEGELTGDRAPDMGPHFIHPTAGATVVGARGPLVAYNIILDSSDLAAAKGIAKKLRTGEAGLEGVKSIGVRLASRSQVQVSMNLTRPELTPLRAVYNYVLGQAHAQGIDIAESELIGASLRRFWDGITPEEMKAYTFKDTQIIDNWLD